MSTAPDTFIFAIDPGLNGAWAVLGRAGEFVNAGDLDAFKKRINGLALVKLLRDFAPRQCVVEYVHAFPQQGVSSVFTFGQSFGTIIGCINGVGLPLNFVEPGRWKRHFKLIGKPKEASIERAVDLYPTAAEFLKRKKDHGRGDAILIARYFLDSIRQGHIV